MASLMTINLMAPVSAYGLGLLSFLLAIGLFNLFAKGDKKPQDVPARLAQATLATAKVIEVRNTHTPSTINDEDLRVAMRLEVDPPFGPSYQTISIWHIQPAHVPDVKAGQTLSVKIDQQNPKIIFPDESLSWASQRDAREMGESDLYGLTQKLDKGTRARFDQSLPASAQVIEVGNSYNERSGYGMSVALRLQVTPADGSPYPVISVWEVQPTHAEDIQVGKTLEIRIDKQNPKVIFPVADWALQTYLKEYTEDDMEN